MSEFFIFNIILFGCIQSMHIYNLSHLLTYILRCEYFNEFFFPEDCFTQEVKIFTLLGVMAILKLSMAPRKFFLNIFSLFIYIFIFILKSQDAKYAKSLNFNIFFYSWLISTVYFLLLSWICLQLYLWVSCVESLTSITEVSVSRTTWGCLLLG